MSSLCEGQAPHIDRTDFLNIVVREKKRFENTLDDCVAAGLNAGMQALMNQVELPAGFLPRADLEIYRSSTSSSHLANLESITR